MAYFIKKSTFGPPSSFAKVQGSNFSLFPHEPGALGLVIILVCLLVVVVCQKSGFLPIKE